MNGLNYYIVTRLDNIKSAIFALDCIFVAMLIVCAINLCTYQPFDYGNLSHKKQSEIYDKNCNFIKSTTVWCVVVVVVLYLVNMFIPSTREAMEMINM